ncbi:MAG TPA: hypothetical protein VMH81_33895 [Bryobacteraceae bacterium]|nr:hypothetical protein [Bryobacteraceae bacterium]
MKEFAECFFRRLLELPEEFCVFPYQDVELRLKYREQGALQPLEDLPGLVRIAAPVVQVALEVVDKLRRALSRLDNELLQDVADGDGIGREYAASKLILGVLSGFGGRQFHESPSRFNNHQVKILLDNGVFGVFERELAQALPQMQGLGLQLFVGQGLCEFRLDGYAGKVVFRLPLDGANISR